MKMRKEVISGIMLITIGSITGILGMIYGKMNVLNLGLSGIILGGIVLAIKSEDYVKRSSLETIVEALQEETKKIVRDLGLEGNAIYIPPTENLPHGAIFIPLYRDYDIDLARISYDTPFLTEVSSENQMGLIIGSSAVNLLKKFEEHLEGEITSVGEAESASSSVLKALELAESVYIEDVGDSFEVYVEPKNIEFCKRNVKDCRQVACPICASILLALAKGSGELIESESFEIVNKRVRIKAKKLGGAEKWM
ncbi:hypothetical protein [Pyrococcus abyssi]|nr:hypothetical protein [Pyrococcus abyssi]